MTNRKRRNQSKNSHDEPVKKQKSIASFFAAPTTSTQEEVTNEVVVTEEETIPPEEPETNDEEVFFSTSMYTDEVNDMINTILEGEKHLLSEDELLLLAQYNSLSDDPKHLLVRLIMRKHDWIRKNTMNYSRNIRDLDAAIDLLKDCNLISTTLEDLGEALNVLLVEELRELLRERNIIMPEQGKRIYAKKLLEFSATSTAGLVTNDTTINAKRIEKLWVSIHERLGTCVKVKDPVYQLFKRLQIIFYRINSLQDTKAMSNSILAKTSKRNFPVYIPCRTNIIWNTREDFISYERALMIEDEFHKRIEKLSVRTSPRNKRLKSAEANNSKLRQAMVDTWTICENCIGAWEDEIAIRGTHERPYYLRRFEAGWIYTRLLDHGTEVLAKLHEYELEEVIVQKLLKQSMYRISKRGKWYDRLAVIQTNHVRKDQGRTQKKIALKTCSDAIQDPKTHQIFLFGLHHRIEQLEKELCIPKREQHDFSYMRRKKPKAITIYGERLSDLEASGRKSIWRNDDGSECTVEQVGIEYYKKQGYKGLHCENGIVRMIVVLLFWDVIFAPIPGVFETPYQTEPFDLRTDSFYESRVDIIQDRLQEIEDGKHLEIIETVDQRERPRKTMCMGINWKYEYQDIIEIAECIGASPLASLCKIYFQEFGQRQGGMPDLCCWDYEKKLCLFSEVKGPNDKLSKTQHEWIEALAGFGIPVEVCHVQVWKGEDVFLV